MKTLTIATMAFGLAAAAASAAWAGGGAYPKDFESDDTGTAKTRAQVVAETRDAVRLGLVQTEAAYPQFAIGDAGGMGKTRVQVAAETREAVRLGLLPREEIAQTTPEQEQQIELAGRRAVADALMAGK